MYNKLRKILAVFIAGTMLLGSVPVQAQEKLSPANRAAYNDLLSHLNRNGRDRYWEVWEKQEMRYSEAEAKKVDKLVQQFSTNTLPDQREKEAFNALFDKLPNSLKRYVFDEASEVATLRFLSEDFRILVPQDFNPKNGRGIVYIQQFQILDDYGRPNNVSKMVRESFAFDAVSGKIYPNAVPSAAEKVSVLRGVGRWENGDIILVSYMDELLARLKSAAVRQNLGYREVGHVLDKEHGEILRHLKSPSQILTVTHIKISLDEGAFYSKVSEIGLGKANHIEFDMVIDPIDDPDAVLVSVKEYYKENLKSIKKLLQAVNGKMQNLKGSKALYAEFLKLMEKDSKFALTTIERFNAKQAAAKKATAKKAGQKAGKTALRSIGGAFFGIGLYAVLTATTANSVQAAEVTVTPKSEIIKKTVAEFKDAQVKSGVEKLAMFADPNKMPLIVRDAKLLIEMGQYQEMLDANGLTVDEAAELIVNEMFAPLAAKEQAKQEVVKKVKHI